MFYGEKEENNKEIIHHKYPVGLKLAKECNAAKNKLEVTFPLKINTEVYQVLTKQMHNKKQVSKYYSLHLNY